MYSKRILASLISIFTLGVVFAIVFRNYDTVSSRVLFAVIGCISVVFFAFSRFNSNIAVSKNVLAAALAVAAFSLGVLRVSLYNTDAGKDVSFNGKEDTITANIFEISENYIDAYITESKLGVNKYTKVRLYLQKFDSKCKIGDDVVTEVRYRYSDKLNLLSDGISLTSSIEDVKILQGAGLLYTVRGSVSENSEEIFGTFYSAPAISKAVSTGDRSGLDSYIYSVYQAGGISHILAISGFHIMLVAMGLRRFLTAITLRIKLSSVISMIVTVLYTALVGFTPGAVRSAVMIMFLLISGLRIKRSDGITSLFLALFLLIFVNPYSICGAGLQLSFLCSLGIMLVRPILVKMEYYLTNRRSSPKRAWGLFSRLFYAIVSSLTVSVAASVFSFPVLCLSFDTISCVSPLTNILIVPLFSYAIGFALLAYLIAPFSTFIASIIAFPAGVIFDGSTWINAFFYENDIGAVSARTPIMYIPLAFSCVIIAVCLFKNRKKNVYVALSTCAFVISLSICCFVNQNMVLNKTYIKYGNKSSEYVYYQSNFKNVYFDLSGYSAYHDIIFEKGRTSLDDYVIIEYDEYSLDRFNYISGNIHINAIYLPKPENVCENNIYSQIKELANARNCDIIEYNISCISLEEKSEQVFLLKDAFASDEYLIGITHNGTAVRIVSDGYSHPINANYLVLTGSYSNSNYSINCDNKYVSSELFEQYKKDYVGFVPYNNNVEFAGKSNESDFKVYES